ncbi:hypothetical protein TWF694_004474 [Orbilia ellipsospora]|uniref:Uncharacterized protein n=1 Tax=Orbilia ellipsospora TaxID=2528407 RepID=A0AAV9WV86_9PEZI
MDKLPNIFSRVSLASTASSKPGNEALDSDPKLRPLLLSRETGSRDIPAHLLPRSSKTAASGINADRRSILSGMSNSSMPSSGRYQPFAPQKADFDALKVPVKPGERCPKCNSNIVLNPLLKKNGGPNVKDAHPSQIFSVPHGTDKDGKPVVIQMVWSCRINRHPYPYTPALKTGNRDEEDDTDNSQGPRMSRAGVERWVNEIRGFMVAGEAPKALEAMRQVVQMNEGRKKESFSWLEKEKANKLASIFQKQGQKMGDKTGNDKALEEGKKLLEQILKNSPEEAATTVPFLDSHDGIKGTQDAKKKASEYSGVIVDSPESSRSASSALIRPMEMNDKGDEHSATVLLHGIQSALANPRLDDANRRTNTKENIKPGLAPDEDHDISKTKVPMDQKTLIDEVTKAFTRSSEDKKTMPSSEENRKSFKVSPKRFSLVNIITPLKKPDNNLESRPSGATLAGSRNSEAPQQYSPGNSGHHSFASSAISTPSFVTDKSSSDSFDIGSVEKEESPPGTPQTSGKRSASFSTIGTNAETSDESHDIKDSEEENNGIPFPIVNFED